MTLTLDWTNIGDFVLRSRIINVLTQGIKFRCLIINLNIFRRLVHNFMNGRGILWQVATFKTKSCDREASQSTRVHLRMLAIAMNLSKNHFCQRARSVHAGLWEHFVPVSLSLWSQIWTRWYNTKVLGMRNYEFWSCQLIVYFQLIFYFCSCLKIWTHWYNAKCWV